MAPNEDEDRIARCFSGLKLRPLLKRRHVQASRTTHTPSHPRATPTVEKIEKDLNMPRPDFGHADWCISPESVLLDSCLPPYSNTSEADAKGDPAVEQTIDTTLDQLASDLHKLSMDIHEHPEIGFQERHARDTLTSFMGSRGFKVTSGYLGLETAWRAEYTHGTGGKVIGINSEMDALPGIGHACGHNLIAASGCGVAVALKAALETHNIPGKIILLGTPAEEGGGGKIILLERGGYDEMDFCVMSHPGPGPLSSFAFGSTNAMQGFEVEYIGQGAHAGGAPWEGKNALDAAFIAYASLSVLRQQMLPTYRSHGIVQGHDWVSNVIPDNAHITWSIRAPTREELTTFSERVRNCFQAAALATGCSVKIDALQPYDDLSNNAVLARVFSDAVHTCYGQRVFYQDFSASTDFGNVSHYLPALHPSFSIPTEPNGQNHTPAFTKASATKEAHAASLISTRGLALTAIRIIQNEKLFREMKASFASPNPNGQNPKV